MQRPSSGDSSGLVDNSTDSHAHAVLEGPTPNYTPANIPAASTGLVLLPHQHLHDPMFAPGSAEGVPAAGYQTNEKVTGETGGAGVVRQMGKERIILPTRPRSPLKLARRLEQVEEGEDGSGSGGLVKKPKSIPLTMRFSHRFTVREKLGEGGFGVVEVCADTTGKYASESELLAVKTISKQALFGTAANYDELVSKRELLQREVEVLQLLKGHKHVVQVKKIYNTPERLRVVMELCDGGNLREYLVARIEEIEAQQGEQKEAMKQAFQRAMEKHKSTNKAGGMQKKGLMPPVPRHSKSAKMKGNTLLPISPRAVQSARPDLEVKEEEGNGGGERREGEMEVGKGDEREDEGSDEDEPVLWAGGLPEIEAAAVFSQLLAAVAFCHSKGVLHRDIKLENALMMNKQQEKEKGKGKEGGGGVLQRSRTTDGEVKMLKLPSIARKTGGWRIISLSRDLEETVKAMLKGDEHQHHQEGEEQGSSGPAASGEATVRKGKEAPAKHGDTAASDAAEDEPHLSMVAEGVEIIRVGSDVSSAIDEVDSALGTIRPTTGDPLALKRMGSGGLEAVGQAVRQEEVKVPTVKLADFGLSVVMKYIAKVQGRCGTEGYMAPEMVAGEEYGYSVDVWSLGVCLHALLFGELPQFNEAEDVIALGVPPPAMHRWKAVSREARDLHSKLLERDPAKRITAEQALDHTWLKKGGKFRRTYSIFEQSFTMGKKENKAKNNIVLRFKFGARALAVRVPFFGRGNKQQAPLEPVRLGKAK